MMQTVEAAPAAAADTDRLGRFARVVARAAHLPRVRAWDWADRAAAALGAGVEPVATVVVILDVQRQVLRAGCALAGVAARPGDHLRHRAERLASAAGTADRSGAWRCAWTHDDLHPFRGAGFAEGDVLNARVELGGGATLWISQWSSGARPESDLGDFLAAAGFVADAARELLGPPGRPAEWLTERETEVLDLVALGHTAREIGEIVGRSVHTIQDHLKSIRRKSGHSTRGALVAAAAGRRLVRPA
jgi:DNA-binding CsgD family transcriptional regulator